MNSLPTPSIHKEYDNWKRNQFTLEEVYQKHADSLGKYAAWKAALENALMYTALRQETYNPDLILDLTPDGIQYGFMCVEIDSDGKMSESILNSIQTALKNYRPISENDSLHWDKSKFSYGDFSVYRNSYIDKAFENVAVHKGEEKGAEKLITASLRYASIFAETRHIGPPQSVYDVFYDWGVRNEGFASPFNARLLGKNQAKFYSLFPDTDKPFGSGGSFFHLSEPSNEGDWSLDPPFLPEIMDKVDLRIRDWRDKFPEVAILYIIPESHTPQIKPDETVVLHADRHYYEGLDGKKQPLPVNVCVHRYGNMKNFEAQAIKKGYEN